MKQIPRHDWLAIAQSWSERSLDWTTVHHEALARSARPATDSQTVFLQHSSILIRINPQSIWFLEDPSEPKPTDMVDLFSGLLSARGSGVQAVIINDLLYDSLFDPHRRYPKPKPKQTILCWSWRQSQTEPHSQTVQHYPSEKPVRVKLVPPKTGEHPFLHQILCSSSGRHEQGRGRSVGQIAIEPISVPFFPSCHGTTAQRLSQLEIWPEHRSQRLGQKALKLALEKAEATFLATDQKAAHLIPYYSSLGGSIRGKLCLLDC